MAKPIGDLPAASGIGANDKFVLEQDEIAKSLTGQILLNWLTAAADGHGGIKSVEKISTRGLADTYRITLADTTTFDFVVTNGRSINSITKTSTSGLVDTYTITYNNGTTSKFTVTNGDKGDKGDNAYIWIKYASQEPTEASHSMGDIPDNWIGIYSGNASTAPSDWKQYKWYKHKGEQGDTGDPATLANKSVTYKVGDSGSITPSGAWSSSVPVVPQGKYLWTKTELKFNTGDPIVLYVSARQGVDGSGSVSSVNNVYPDSNGDVTLTAANVRARPDDWMPTAADVDALPVLGGDMEGPIAMGGNKVTGLGTPTADDEAVTKAYADKMLPKTGGTMTGAINMGGHPISGLNDPTDETQVARKGYVDAAVNDANAYTDASARKAAPRNLLDNSDFTNPVNQRGATIYTGEYGIDRWRVWNSDTMTVNSGYITVNGTVFQYLLPSVVQNSVHTLAAKKTDGSILLYIKNPHEAYSTADNGLGLGLDNNVVVSIPTGSYLWAALYEGEYTAETLPEYHPKGYAAESAECYRYYFLYGEETQWWSLPAFKGTTSAYAHIQTPVEMRTTPTIYCSALLNVMLNGNIYMPISLTECNKKGSTICITVDGHEIIPASQSFVVSPHTRGTLSFNADL